LKLNDAAPAGAAFLRNSTSNPTSKESYCAVTAVTAQAMYEQLEDYLFPARKPAGLHDNMGEIKVFLISRPSVETASYNFEFD
jgi:hypothetical protein